MNLSQSLNTPPSTDKRDGMIQRLVESETLEGINREIQRVQDDLNSTLKVLNNNPSLTGILTPKSQNLQQVLDLLKEAELRYPKDTNTQ